MFFTVNSLRINEVNATLLHIDTEPAAMQFVFSTFILSVKFAGEDRHRSELLDRRRHNLAGYSWNSTGPTPRRTSSPTFARKSACPATSPFSLPRAGQCARRSSPTCPPTCPIRALFLVRMSVGDARVYTCTCTVHDKLLCTRLQNYTIGASLKSVSVSVSVLSLIHISEPTRPY